jgi:glycogen debranching enzyme
VGNVGMILVMATVLVGSSTGTMGDGTVRIGSYYADALNGIAFIAGGKTGDTAAFLLRVGWVGPDGKYNEGYPQLVENDVRIGPAAPDGSYNRVSWKAGAATVRFEWGRTGAAGVVGRVTADGPVRIALRTCPSWKEFASTYKLVEDTIEGAGGLAGKRAGAAIAWRLVTRRSPLAQVCSNDADAVAAAIADGESPNGSEGAIAALVFDLTATSPVEFVAGVGELALPAQVESLLAAAERKYMAERATAAGDCGDFVEPIANNLNNSRLYNHELQKIAHSVSRGWCLPDGQILFEWDSFFNGLLASLEDPKGGRETIRALLAYQEEDGSVPNHAGPEWGVSTGRSQPPVGAMCVWKMHQRWPDRAFLAEVYPKLVKWHGWWFATRPSNGLPYRDGNKNGLLEWGNEDGGLQGGKWESGLDDSPMFDDAATSGPNMMLDSVDLNSLWAADAEFLARIAAALGKPAEAHQFRSQRDDMAKRINELLWNEELGIYCNRYWEPRRPTTIIPGECLFTDAGGPGLAAEYFAGTAFETPKLTRTDQRIDFNWNDTPPDPALGLTNYSVRWIGKIRPATSGEYMLETSSDDGVRVWLDRKLVIDNWTVHPPTTDRSTPMRLDAGKEYGIRVEFYQKEGGAEIHLRWTDPSAQPEVLSPRLSPTCFYPMIAGIPDKARAERMLRVLQDPKRFWGEYVCPTIARDDPAFPDQHYWRGKIWAPTNYLMYQGLKRYASDALRAEFARKSVALFMRNWTAHGTCHENFLASGEGASDPHYTWGALLCLIGIEELCDLEPDGRLRLNGGLPEDLQIRHLPLNGEVYDIHLRNGRAELLRGDKTILTATGGPKSEPFAPRGGD